MAKIYVHDQWPELLANKGSHKNHPFGSSFISHILNETIRLTKMKFQYIAISDMRIKNVQSFKLSTEEGDYRTCSLSNDTINSVFTTIENSIFSSLQHICWMNFKCIRSIRNVVVFLNYDLCSKLMATSIAQTRRKVILEKALDLWKNGKETTSNLRLPTSTLFTV